RVSRAFPDVPFHLVGRHLDDSVDELRRIAGQNMHFTGWISDAELVDLLSRAQVYVQCSYNEGFGVALAEAMASGCVPVVVATGAIPEVVGDTGVYAKYGELDGLAAAIQTALDSEKGSAARQRVVDKFNEQYRLADLRAAVNRVLSKAPRRKSETAGGF
ncbi:glycosyltransferase, partial [Candidatus Bathyarchaeota archaeon]